MRQAQFHLSIAVHSVDESLRFFEDVLQASVRHTDPTGYVNIDLFGSQITLKPYPGIDPALPELHFGINLGLEEFDALSQHIIASGYEPIVMQPTVVDAGTAMERKKMYVRCPTGYLIEIKGSKQKR